MAGIGVGRMTDNPRCVTIVHYKYPSLLHKLDHVVVHFGGGGGSSAEISIVYSSHCLKTIQIIVI